MHSNVSFGPNDSRMKMIRKSPWRVVLLFAASVSAVQTADVTSTDTTLAHQPDTNGDVCTDCTAFLTDISVVMKNATTQEMVISKLKQICVIVESPSCSELVDDYGILLLSYAAEHFVPREVCENFAQCPSPVSVQKKMFQIYKPQTTGNVCGDCLAFMTDVLDELKNTTIQNEIFYTLEQLCAVFGSSTCASDVRTYGEFVFIYLQTIFVPKKACVDLSFCPQSKAVQHYFLFLKPKSPGDMCNDCVELMKDFSVMLKNATTQKLMVSKLKLLCQVFGSSSCYDTVNKYGSLVFAYLPTFFEPHTTCAALDFCKQPMLTVNNKFPYTKMEGVDVCMDCVALMADVSITLKNTTNQKIFVGKLKQVCEVWGFSSCVDWLDSYGALVFNYLPSLFVPRGVCADLALCPPSHELTLAKKHQVQKILDAVLLKAI